jgi:hypothetical protein
LRGSFNVRVGEGMIRIMWDFGEGLGKIDRKYIDTGRLLLHYQTLKSSKLIILLEDV